MNGYRNYTYSIKIYFVAQWSRLHSHFYFHLKKKKIKNFLNQISDWMEIIIIVNGYLMKKKKKKKTAEIQCLNVIRKSGEV
jgi:transposase